MAKKTRPRGEGGKRRAPERKRSLLSRLLRFLSILLIWSGILGLGGFAYFSYDLPETDTLAGPPRNPAVRVLAADGTEIATYGHLSGEFVTVEGVPPVLVQAVIAAEDRRFYRHFGIDLVGILRAAVANIEAGRVVQGGSTITQQLAKITFLTPERTIKRKVQEILLALWLDQKFTKEEILTIYLNRVYLGAGTYGVDAATWRYFGKPAQAVDLAEAAMLAGLLKAPSHYAPTRDLALAQRRAGQVLSDMVGAGFLSAEEANEARRLPARLAGGRAGGLRARYFADWVLEQVPAYVGPRRGDLTVLTTLNPRLQRLAEEAVEAALARDGARLDAGQAALVALSPEGSVRAMVGGRDYRKSQYNRATQALRQPGSAFKLVVYLAALEAGSSPADEVLDAPITLGGWSPANYDGRYRGAVSLKEAFAHSLNSVAVRVGRKVGLKRILKTAQRLGITAALPEEATLTLGTGAISLIELTQAYGALSHGGERVLAHGIKEIRGPGGEVLYRRTGSGAGEAISPRALAAMRSMLAAVVEEGTGRAAALGALGPAFGKTGTSQDFRDAWFVGFAGGLVAGVWVGNDDARPMKGVTGGGLPARIWKSFMTAASSSSP